MHHDPLCELGASGALGCQHQISLSSERCKHCAGKCNCRWIAKIRADQVQRDEVIIRDFGWSPETDDADIDQVISDLKEALDR